MTGFGAGRLSFHLWIRQPVTQGGQYDISTEGPLGIALATVTVPEAFCKHPIVHVQLAS